MQNPLQILYPTQCLTCDQMIECTTALCGACWRETPFIGGLACYACGAPLPGDDDGFEAHCEDCLQIERPWRHGAAVFQYKGVGRKLVMALKSADRLDVVRPAAQWMSQKMPVAPTPQLAIVPVPVHWSRLIARRYNQSALLAQALSRLVGAAYVPDALIRHRRTPKQDGLNPGERFENLSKAVMPHPKRPHSLQGRQVLLVDDVMTSGATFAACTEAAFAAGASDVCVIALARVTKDP